MIKNLIFDWSGTLVDDLPAVWEASNRVFVRAGVPPLTLEQFRAEFCLPFKPFYDRYIPHVALAELEEWFHAHFREAQHSAHALPHAREFLEFCRQHGIRSFLLSTLRPDHFQVQSRENGFAEFFEHAYLGVLDKRAKIAELLQTHRLEPGETLFVGDMQHDIDTARHGGIHSCGVLTGYNRLAQLRQSEPDMIVEHLGELHQYLAQHQFRWVADGVPSRVYPIATVGALIFNPDGLVLLVRTHKWSDLWGIPGGKIKWGETSLDALRREIKEETNLEIANIRFVLVQDCIRSQEFYRDAHFVLLNYTVVAPAGQAVILNDEAREYRWLSMADAEKLPLNQPTRILLETVQAAKECPWIA